ncbi:MAG: glycosyltransferase [Desulfatirhabdiaceae bacterium]|nr:glycosyltransferase [Desulfatirhabdiaceae bacterium]
MTSRFHPKMVQGIGAFISDVIFLAVLLVPGERIVGSPYYLVGSVGMFICMLWIMKYWSGKKMLAAVLLLSLLVKVAMLIQFPDNSDINRYVWEGEIQLSGYNPFVYAPEAEELKHLRNENWEDINFKSLTAIYWPFAQLLFKACAAISPTRWFFNTILSLFSVGIIVLLLLLLRPFSHDFREIVLYALNPLTIISVAGEGHLESILVFWILLSLYGSRQKKPWLMYLSLGLAIMTKLTPIIFLPLLVERGNLKYFPFFLLPFALMLPYYDPGISFLSTFNIFISSFKYNGMFDYVCQALTGVLPSTWVSMFFAAGLCGFVFFLTPDRLRSVYLVSGILLIFIPTFHTWYLLLITPFLVFYCSWPWIILHLTMLPLVFVFHPWATHPFWHDQPLLQGIEFIPFIAAGLWCFWKNRQYWPVRFPPARSVSVIILTDSASRNVVGCIQSIDNRDCPVEVIVVESGFVHGIPDIVQAFPDVKILSSAPGRGLQIQNGIKSAKNDVIVLLHADSRLMPGAISRMLTALQGNDSVVGGCFGATYDDSRSGTRLNRLVPVLNRIWVVASGISVGNQAKFFRREAIQYPLPAIKLVEDIELSLCMKEKGAMVFIPGCVTGAAREHKPAENWTDYIKAIYVMIRYLTLRRLNPAK